MPKAKYQHDKKTGYYYTYVDTGELLADGKKKYKKIRGKTIARVDEKIKEYQEQKTLCVEPTKLTVEQWYSEWFRSYKSGCAIKTQNYYKYLYEKHISPKIGNRRLTSIKQADCNKVLNDMSAEYSLETIKGTRRVLYSLFNTAEANKLISYNPAEKLSARGKISKHRRALTTEERKAFLTACEEQNYIVGFFLYFFGLRRGECLALTSDDVDDKFITVNKQILYPDNMKPLLSNVPKTDSGNRKIPIPNEARKYIDFNNLPKGLLFPNADGEVQTYANQNTAWERVKRAAFGRDSEITKHYLRHNYCCLLFESGVDLMTVKEVAGHKDIETTLKIYTHYTDSLKTLGIEKILNIG